MGFSLKRLLYIFIFMCSFLIISHAHASLILHVDNDGLLIGADNVLVDGSLYNVRFSDNTGRELFGVSGGGFDFGPVNDINKAFFTQALLGQVLLGVYDTMPELTFGCENTDNDTCRIFTAFRVFPSGNIGASVAVNLADSLEDGFSSGNPFPDDQFDVYPQNGFQPNTFYPQQQVWAVWSRVNNQSVPEPVSYWVFVAGLIVVICQRSYVLSKRKMYNHK